MRFAMLLLVSIAGCATLPPVKRDPPQRDGWHCEHADDGGEHCTAPRPSRP